MKDAEEAVFCDTTSALAELRRSQALRDCGLFKSAAAAAKLSRLKHEKNSGGCRDDDFDDDLRKLEASLQSHARTAAAAVEQEDRRRLARRRQGFSIDIRRRQRQRLNNEAEEEEEGTPHIHVHVIERNEDGNDDDDDEEDEEEEENAAVAAAVVDNDADEFGAASVAKIDADFAAALEKYAQTAIFQGETTAHTTTHGSIRNMSPWLWGALPSASTYLQRYVGHCNMQTDIKEAVFLGKNDEFIASGSDDGWVYLYEASTGACLRVLHADADVVNCIRPHPFLPMVATSGIDSTVKIWSPCCSSSFGDDCGDSIDERERERENINVERRCGMNQGELRRMGPRLFMGGGGGGVDFGVLQILRAVAGAAAADGGGGGGGGGDNDNEGDDDDDEVPVQCRVS